MPKFGSWIVALLMVAFAVVLENSTRNPVRVKPLVITGAYGSLKDYDINTDLRNVQILGSGSAHAPETLIISTKTDQIYALCEDGWIMEVLPNGETRHAAFIGGRPLGGAFDQDGNLIIAEPAKGLCMVHAHSLQISRSGGATMAILSNIVEKSATPIRYANDVAVAEDGSIFFSDATIVAPSVDENGRVDTLSSSILDVLSGSDTGRLLKYDPQTKTTTELMSGLKFANGVSISPDGSYVAVVETFASRIHKYFLKGEKAGKSEVVIENIPGLPDGMSIDDQGRFWVAVVSPVTPVMKFVFALEGLSPKLGEIVRSFLIRMPKGLRPQPQKYGLVMLYDSDGKFLRAWHDPDGQKVTAISAVTYHKGKVYLGSLKNDFVAVLEAVD